MSRGLLLQRAHKLDSIELWAIYPTQKQPVTQNPPRCCLHERFTILTRRPSTQSEPPRHYKVISTMIRVGIARDQSPGQGGDDEVASCFDHPMADVDTAI